MTAPATHRIEVATRPSQRDPVGDSVRQRIAEDLGIYVADVRVIDVYTIAAKMTSEETERVRVELFTDPIIQESAVGLSLASEYDHIIEVGYQPGVTDNIGKSAARGISDVLGRPLQPNETVYKSIQYVFRGASRFDCERIVRDLLANDLIQRWEIHPSEDGQKNGVIALLDPPVPTVRNRPTTREREIIDATDKQLIEMSDLYHWALSLEELRAIEQYFKQEDVRKRREDRDMPKNPWDIEMEILAQTWSEHCKHKIFNTDIIYTHASGHVQKIKGGLFKNYVKAVTDTVRPDVDWLRSVFDDNAGIIKFDDEWNFALKVETHNSPSALDPYGGAMTGIVGVNRDILGAGMGCRCCLNTDVFCVASPYHEGTIPTRLLHPKRVLRGVHEGVKDGGNQSGIPDVNGAIVFHERFLGKPLVFCGTGGLIPRQVGGMPSEFKRAEAGDKIVMVGGRIGLDGIHGATFSSEELHEESPKSAVQIGDPITQKKMSDFLIEARDRGLYTSITDNGAGGLSSSVGEMAQESGGAKVFINSCPLKYEGLAPWEIFLSEAQERMTLSVPHQHVEDLMTLAAQREVEATVIGEFTETGLLECFYNYEDATEQGELVASLNMDFLHGRAWAPAKPLVARDPDPQLDYLDLNFEFEGVHLNDDLGASLKAVLGALNVCSKEYFVRMYDHEVLGQSVLKQFQGAESDGPGDAAVIRPVHGSKRGVAIACGICPKYSDLDAYAMTAAAVDEAVRNLICVGAKMGQIAGLDNFCWPDPVQSEKTPDGEYKLAQLVRSCEALRYVCVEYSIPLISGKDSMKNDYKIGDTKISVPPTVLFTAVAVVDDATKSVSMDAKRPGDVVYALGTTKDEMGGSEYLTLKGGIDFNVPKVDAPRFRKLYEKLSEAIARGLVASCHDCSDGGLGVALAETAFAGGYGMELDIGVLDLASDDVALFSESQGRFVVTVEPAKAGAFEEALEGAAVARLGVVTEEGAFRLKGRQGPRIDVPIAELKKAWQEPLAW